MSAMSGATARCQLVDATCQTYQESRLSLSLTAILVYAEYHKGQKIIV
jgi:hypothetical protein